MEERGLFNQLESGLIKLLGKLQKDPDNIKHSMNPFEIKRLEWEKRFHNLQQHFKSPEVTRNCTLEDMQLE